MAFQRSHQFTIRGIPDLGGAIIAGGDDLAAIRTEGDGIDSIGMAGDREQRPAARRVPQFRGMIQTGGEYAGAIPAKSCPSEIIMIFYRDQQLAAHRLPNFRGVIFRASNYALIIGTE